MEKLVYLIHESADTPGAKLREALVGPVADALTRAGATRIAVNVDDDDVAPGEKVSIRRSAVPIRAMVSFWMHNADDRALCEEVLRGAGQGLDGYLVVESVPLVNTTQNASPRERTPGANLVTCIRKLASIDRDEFLHRWYVEHKEVALATQSTFTYIRNTVVRPLTPGAPDWDGIVEESFPIEALTDPSVWYDAVGSPELLQERVKGMVASVEAFLDLSVLESTPMSEYLLE